MLLEFDADQRLWQQTARDVVTKECPASLVRSVAEDGADTSPLWKVYVDLGWTELSDAASAVELAIVLEELQDRIATGMSHAQAVPLYRMLHKRFLREML